MIEAICVEYITVIYQKSVALKGVSFSVEESECKVIIGPNGSGKTTLLKVLNGLVIPAAGRIKILGKEMNNKTASSLRKRIGYVPQIQEIDKKFPISVNEVVAIGRLSKGHFLKRWTHEDIEQIELAMKITGIMPIRSKPIGHLSGGEQQKVAIARALAQEPDILLLDEPTSSLDPYAQHAVIDLINQINTIKKLPMVLVTHLLDYIPACAEKLILMKEGKIIAEGKKTDLINAHVLTGLYSCDRERIAAFCTIAGLIK